MSLRLILRLSWKYRAGWISSRPSQFTEPLVDPGQMVSIVHNLGRGVGQSSCDLQAVLIMPPRRCEILPQGREVSEQGVNARLETVTIGNPGRGVGQSPGNRQCLLEASFAPAGSPSARSKLPR